MEYIVDVEDLWFKYHGMSEWALRGVKLQVKPGEFVVVMGPSGCGKSTLALTLTGAGLRLLLGEAKGKVVVDGLNAFEAPPQEISQRLGIVFQNPETQLVTMTVREELAFGPENLRLPPDEIERRVREVAGSTGLLDKLNRPVNALSGGEKQAVAVASVLTLRPKIIVLDEITSMLDPVGMMRITELTERMHQEHGLTVIAIDHRVEWASEIAHRIIIMNEGRVELNGSPEEVFAGKDFVRKVGFRAPQVAEVAYGLMEAGRSILVIPVTLGQAGDIYGSMLEARKLAAHRS